MEINNSSKPEESFIPDIIPPEVKEPEIPSPIPTPIPIPPAPQPTVTAPKPKAAEVLPPFHVHHAIVGLSIAGASTLVFLVPWLKPITKVALAGLGVTVGALLVYDDLQQHWESGCDVRTIFDFTPCAQKVVIVKKP